MTFNGVCSVVGRIVRAVMVQSAFYIVVGVALVTISFLCV